MGKLEPLNTHALARLICDRVYSVFCARLLSISFTYQIHTQQKWARVCARAVLLCSSDWVLFCIKIWVFCSLLNIFFLWSHSINRIPNEIWKIHFVVNFMTYERSRCAVLVWTEYHAVSSNSPICNKHSAYAACPIQTITRTYIVQISVDPTMI